MLDYLTIVEPGEFIRPSIAKLISVPDKTSESALLGAWQKVGPCLGSPKYDGWRFQIHKVGERVNLFSRRGEDWAKEFPSIVQMIQTQVEDDQVIMDTELVGFDQNGHHLEPSKLRYTQHYHCYLLDALYLGGKNLVPIPTQERVASIKERLHNAFCDNFTFAEYTNINSQEELIKFYQECRRRRREGFDGTIIRRLDAPYHANILKLKTEDTTDAVIIGANKDKKGAMQSFLLAVPSHELKLWVPIAKVTRTNTDWETIRAACQPYTLKHRPSHLDRIPQIPDIWIAPRVVVEITMTELHPGKGYLVRAVYPRKCTLREDKGPEDATSLEQILQMAGLTEIMMKLSERSKQQQLSLFEEYASATIGCNLDEYKEAGKVTLFEEISPKEDITLQTNLPNERPTQLQFSLFEQINAAN